MPGGRVRLSRRGGWGLRIEDCILFACGSDADSDEKGHGDDYGPESDGPVYDEWWELNDDRAYWRRRFLILCGGIVALGVCAWLLPGTHHAVGARRPSRNASMAALARRQALPVGRRRARVARAEAIGRDPTADKPPSPTTAAAHAAVGQAR